MNKIKKIFDFSLSYPHYTVADILNQSPFHELVFWGEKQFLIKGLADIIAPTFAKIIFIESTKNLRLLESLLEQGNVFLLPLTFQEHKSIINAQDKHFFFAKNEIWQYWVALLTLFDPHRNHSNSSVTTPKTIKQQYPQKKIQIGENVIFAGDIQTIGENVSFLGNNYIGANCSIGNNVVIHPGVVIERGSKIGNNVVINANTVIGKRGFGFKPILGRPVAIPHIGNVIIGDHVEIGANVVIDRATINSTIIGNYVKIDSLVQVAHNVIVDDGSILVAQSGIAGSSRLGKNVILAGQAGVADHCILEDGVILGGQTGIPSRAHITANKKMMGSPAMEMRQYLRLQQILKNTFLSSKREKNEHYY